MKRKIIYVAVAVILLGIGIAIGSAGKSSTTASPITNVSTIPGPTVTVIQHATVTASPAQPGKGQTLISKQGLNQNWNSPGFNIGSNPVVVSYSYSNCPDGQGNFIADLITTAGQTSNSYEDLSIANAIANGGSDKTTEYPQYPGNDYYLSVQTECTFSIKVTSQG